MFFPQYIFPSHLVPYFITQNSTYPYFQIPQLSGSLDTP